MSRRARACALTLVLVLAACQAPRERSSEKVGAARATSAPDTVASIAEPGAPAARQDTSFVGSTEPIRRPGPSAPPVAILRAVRTAEHTGFDRVVFEFAEGALPGYHLAYVDAALYACGSGAEVKVAGAAQLSVRLEPARAHDDRGNVTIADRRRTLALPALKSLTIICDFEAQVEWVLGLSARTPYRVIELAEPTRLVIDIRHR